MVISDASIREPGWEITITVLALQPFYKSKIIPKLKACVFFLMGTIINIPRTVTRIKWNNVWNLTPSTGDTLNKFCSLPGTLFPGSPPTSLFPACSGHVSPLSFSESGLFKGNTRAFFHYSAPTQSWAKEAAESVNKLYLVSLEPKGQALTFSTSICLPR